MNRKSDSRILLLEQLESRNLLAGGVFASANVGHDHHHDRPEPSGHVRKDDVGGTGKHQVDRNLPNANRPNSTDRLAPHDRPARHRGNDRIDFQSEPRDGVTVVSPNQPPSALSPPRNLGSTSAVSAFEPPQASGASKPELSLALIGRTNPEQNQSPVDSAVQSQSGSPSLVPDRQVANSFDRAIVSGGDGNQVVAQSTEVGDASDSDTRDRDSEIVSNNPNRLTISSRSDALQIASRNFLNNVSVNTSVNSAPGNGDDASLIDTFPLLWRQPIAPSEEQEADAWELNPETLKRLSEVTDPTGPDSAGQPVDLASQQFTDTAIAQWFGGPGGLIELPGDRAAMVLDLLPAGGVDGAVVNIVLDATMGLHRSFDLIAGDSMVANVVSPDEDSVRDAVLAAISGEQSETVSPIQPPFASRLSGLAYPGAALVASGLVMAARRRDQFKLMQST